MSARNPRIFIFRWGRRPKPFASTPIARCWPKSALLRPRRCFWPRWLIGRISLDACWRLTNWASARISSLGVYPKKEVENILLRELNSDSYQNTIAEAAIRAMRAQNDPDYINPLIGALRHRESKFTSGGYARALETLAYLAREQEKKE